MEQRIAHAVSLAHNEHPGDKHIYFVSGWRGEAKHMNARILQLYKDAGLSPPVVEMDTEAMFTVMNFLKTIPMINKHCEELDMVYMITSDYHIPRSQAILDEFVEQRLCKVEIRAEGAPHPGFDMDGWRAQVEECVFGDNTPASVENCVEDGLERFDNWLLTNCNACCAKPHPADDRHPVLGWISWLCCAGIVTPLMCTNANPDEERHVYKAGSNPTRLKDILDPRRDRSNAAIFAKLCRCLIDTGSRAEPNSLDLYRLIRQDMASAEATASAEDRRNHRASMVEQYCKNNGAKNAKARAEKVQQLRELCGAFAASF